MRYVHFHQAPPQALHVLACFCSLDVVKWKNMNCNLPSMEPKELLFFQKCFLKVVCTIVNHRVEKSPAECLENLMVFIQIQHACSTLIIQNNSQVFPCSVEVQIEAEFILVP